MRFEVVDEDGMDNIKFIIALSSAGQREVPGCSDTPGSSLLPPPSSPPSHSIQCGGVSHSASIALMLDSKRERG